MTKKVRVGLLFGGRSGEHEVSLLSAKSIYEAIDKDKYEVILIGIDKEGHWLLNDESHYLLSAASPKLISLDQAHSKKVAPVSHRPTASLLSIDRGQKLGSVDVIFPIMHGTDGEDGSMQGLLEILNVAYVGSGVVGSALGMDKDVMKRLLNQAGIKTAQFITLRKSEADTFTLNDVLEKMTLPVFIKPANLGSSVGVSKVGDKRDFQPALDNAFLYDIKILIEEGVSGREVECSVLGNNEPIASVVGEVIPTHEFYSYEAKYIDANGARLKIPADLPKNLIKRIQALAIKTFQTLEASGMARVDFFVKSNGEVLVNEINTIPGFTKISMYPKLWEVSGVPYAALLDKLINLAIEKKNEKDGLRRSFC
ncbi:D-alanine--D-alanine ligase [Candidatus Roizmanbacteria bacterium]|nr:D-alanine--D-alanine ligase [Candidatus Roizmanbacteria bacterium]